jgi:hypothetical protein
MNTKLILTATLLANALFANAMTVAEAVPVKQKSSGNSIGAKPLAIANSESPSPSINPMTQDELNELLDKRLVSSMGLSFAHFSNMFFTYTYNHFNRAVGLATANEKIANATLSTPFPVFYKSSLREFLDAIALQTSSKWKYDATDKFVKNLTKHQSPKNIAIFEFIDYSDRPKPYEIKVANDWKVSDHGNWVQHTPPGESVGMDIYEMGSYSAPDKTQEADLLKRVPNEVALEWAKRVQAKASIADMKPAKVGPYDAIFFDAMVKSQLKKDVRWRQWVFMVGNKCYFIVSTIFPESESKVYPAVEEMLKSFHSKQ